MTPLIWESDPIFEGSEGDSRCPFTKKTTEKSGYPYSNPSNGGPGWCSWHPWNPQKWGQGSWTHFLRIMETLGCSLRGQKPPNLCFEPLANEEIVEILSISSNCLWGWLRHQHLSKCQKTASFGVVMWSLNCAHVSIFCCVYLCLCAFSLNCTLVFDPMTQ